MTSTSPSAQESHIPVAHRDDSSGIRLFFIVGRARSGTTLLQTMLDANPHLAVAPECQIVMNLYSRYRTADWNRAKILRFHNDLWRESRLVTWELNKEKLKTELIQRAEREMVETELIFSHQQSDLIAKTYRIAHVLERNYLDGKVILKVRGLDWKVNQIKLLTENVLSS